MLGSEASRAKSPWNYGLWAAAAIVALIGVGLKSITNALPSAGAFVTTIFGSPLAWFILAVGLFLTIRPIWTKAPDKSAEVAEAHVRGLGERAGAIARFITKYRGTGQLWRDGLPPLAPIVLDGRSLLMSFEKAGFVIPRFQTSETERIAVGMEHYFSLMYPFIRDGHSQTTMQHSGLIAKQAEESATSFVYDHWWTNNCYS